MSRAASSVEQVRTNLPTFLVIGAMKAGTTSLYHYLGSHPQVCMSSVKELDFFVEHANWRRGTAWYGGQFANGRYALARGEVSTAYTKYPRVQGVPERIAQVVPDARFIYVVRDPIERIRSHHRHRVAIGAERAPIDEAVFADPIYLDCSRYAAQIHRYHLVFPRDQLLPVTSEGLRNERAATMRMVFTFIGVDPVVAPEALSREYYASATRGRHPPAVLRFRRGLKRHLPAAKRAKELVDSALPSGLPGARRSANRHGDEMSAATRTRLADELRPDVVRLRELMPPGFDGWGIA